VVETAIPVPLFFPEVAALPVNVGVVLPVFPDI
jgi:hypothetical protein